MQEELTTKIDCSHLWFIKQDRLGLIEEAVRRMTYASTKRKRQIEFNSVSQVLKRLKLVPPECKIISLAFGTLDHGERGLIISATIPVEIIPAPQEAA